MRILFLIPSLEIGGAQSFLLRLASALCEKNEVLLFNIHPRKVDVKFYHSLASKKIRLFQSRKEKREIFIEKYFPSALSKWIIRILHKIRRPGKVQRNQIRRIIRNYDINLINSHMYLADFFIYNMIEYLPGHIKWISSLHGCYNLLLENARATDRYPRVYDQCRSILQRADGIVVAAERHFEALNLLKVEERKVKKIYYGLNIKEHPEALIREKHHILGDSLVFGMLARGDASKGWEEAIQAFLNIDGNIRKNSFLLLTGDGTYLEGLKEKYRMEEQIIFTGPTDNPLGVINNYNVGILPTAYAAESLPNSVIEYLHCGKPVIATDWAEIPKMIETREGPAGITVPVKNHKADHFALSRAMQSYLQDSGLLQRHIARARDAFIKFEMGQCVHEYLLFFTNALSN